MAQLEALAAKAEKAQEGSGARELSELWRVLCRWVSRCMSSYHILVASGLLILLPVAHNAIHLGFALFLALILYPARRRQADRVSFVDVACMVVSLAIATYTFYMQQFQQETFLYRSGETSNLELLLGVGAIAAVFEGSRRVMGWPLPIIALIFLIYGFVSRYLPGPLHTAGFSFERIINHLFVSGGGIWGTVLSVSARDVFMFILFASFFASSGVGETLVKLAVGLFGSVRGGPAKVSTVASALFGTISGSAVANILTTGSFTIPMMKGIGYAPRFAGAVEAVASTGGMFTPPFMGAAAFIMAEYLGVSYGQIIISAAIPALLYYAALYFSIDIEAQRAGLKGLPRQELPHIKGVLRSGWYQLLPLVLLVYLLVGLDFSPSRAALYGIGSIVVLQVLFRRSISDLVPSLEEGAKAAVQVATTCALVGIVVGMIELTGLGVKLSQALIMLSGGSLPVLLFITMVASLVLGMGLPPSACYITLAILVAPTLVRMGVEPLAAHYFVFMFGIMSMITPPVAISSYVAASVAGADMFATGWTALRIAIPSFVVPFMFVYGPQLLALGSALEVIYTTAVAILGVWAFASGVWGWLRGKAALLERLLLLGGGLLLIKPGLLTDLLGVALVIVAILHHVARSRRLRSWTVREQVNS